MQGQTTRRADAMEEFSLRMLGQTFTLTRNQWEQLRDMLDPKIALDTRDAQELAVRIDARLTRD